MLPNDAIAYIKLCESCSLAPYLDSVGAATQGWGQTYHPNGDRVAMSDSPITQAYADEWFYQTLSQDFWPNIQAIPAFDKFSDWQQAALLSFSYNLGYTYGSDKFESLNKALRNRNWRDVPKILLKYRNPGSESELGLARRRLGEAFMWNGSTADVAYKNAWNYSSVPQILEAIA